MTAQEEYREQGGPGSDLGSGLGRSTDTVESRAQDNVELRQVGKIHQATPIPARQKQSQ